MGTVCTHLSTMSPVPKPLAGIDERACLLCPGPVGDWSGHWTAIPAFRVRFPDVELVVVGTAKRLKKERAFLCGVRRSQVQYLQSMMWALSARASLSPLIKGPFCVEFELVNLAV